MDERTVVFIDGSNFYHGFINSAKGPGFQPADYKHLDFMALARKLAKGRHVKEVRYYIGKLKQEGNPPLYTRQRQWLSALERSGVTCRLGRVEKRKRQGKDTMPLAKWLAALPEGKFNLDPDLRRDLEALCRTNLSHRLGSWLNDLSAGGIRLPPHIYKALQQLRHARSGVTWTEKAVDVMIATDLISMAHQDCYDVAYLLSADGDFTPVVDAVHEMGRKVFVASPMHSAALADHADVFILLRRKFFTGLRRSPKRRPY